MKRSKLRDKVNRNRNHENWCNFKFQRNNCVKTFVENEEHYYENLSVKCKCKCNGQPNLLENRKTIFPR